MDHIADGEPRFHSVHDIDAAGHVHGARTGCRLHRHRLGGALRAVQAGIRDQLTGRVRRKRNGGGTPGKTTPPIGISPPYHRCTANSPSATIPYRAGPMPQRSTIAASSVAVSPAEEANMMI